MISSLWRSSCSQITKYSSWGFRSERSRTQKVAAARSPSRPRTRAAPFVALILSSGTRYLGSSMSALCAEVVLHELLEVLLRTLAAVVDELAQVLDQLVLADEVDQTVPVPRLGNVRV